MLVQCPECTTKYNLDESRIGADGTKVRCTRCKHVFSVFKPMSEEDDIQDLLDPIAAPPVRKQAESMVDKDMLADLEGAFQQPLIEPDAKTNSLLDPDAKLPKKKSSSFLLVLFLLLLLTAGAGAGVYLLRPAWIPWLSRVGTHPAPPTPSAPAASTAPENKGGPVSQIALENVRQYFVPNEKEGQLFIIEGKASNHFQEAKEMIKLKASLFDKKGNVVVSQEFMCGNVVSLYQLQVSAKQDIEAALSSRVGILTNNTNLQPGSSAPFMVVFFKAPDTVEEFGLEVLQAPSTQKQ